MKIKHFTGYGSVNAEKISHKRIYNEYGESQIELKVKVRGNHERGIEIGGWDGYLAFDWLLGKHFGKNLDYYKDFVSFSTQDDYEKLPNGIDEEVCIYTFILRDNK